MDIFADKETVEKRRLICFTCPNYNMGVPTQTSHNLARCKVCKCFIMPKTKLAILTSCPIGKW